MKIWTAAAYPPRHLGYLTTLCLFPDDGSLTPAEREHWKAVARDRLMSVGWYVAPENCPLPLFHGRQPASAALGDAGLWSACTASRWAVRRVYNQHMTWLNIGNPLADEVRLFESPSVEALERQLSKDEWAYYYALGRWNMAVCLLKRGLDRARACLEKGRWFELEARVRDRLGQDNGWTNRFKLLYGIPPDTDVVGDGAFLDLPLPTEALVTSLLQCRPWTISPATVKGSSEKPAVVSGERKGGA